MPQFIWSFERYDQKRKLTFAYISAVPFTHQYVSAAPVLQKLAALFFCNFNLFKYMTFKMEKYF